ncbi:MAG: class I SAM-dependent methyltransferase [Chloroflexota bacterium]
MTTPRDTMTGPIRRPDEHVIISGVGRAGTTFLVRYLTLLGFDTGFSAAEAVDQTDPIAHAGLEHPDLAAAKLPYVIKSPWYTQSIAKALASGEPRISTAILAVRNLFAAAESRRDVSRRWLAAGREERAPGGLWMTSVPDEQEAVLAAEFHNLVEELSRARVRMLFLHYPEFVRSHEVLYAGLGAFLSEHGVTAEGSLAAYGEAVDPALVHDYPETDDGEWHPAEHVRLSVVVVAYDMARELPRTLTSLTPAYQQHIAPDEYEVIVVDNGSPVPVDLASMADVPAHWRVIRIDPAPGSPARAINVGLAAAQGDVIGVMIDGARLVTPGVLHFALAGAGLAPRAVVTTLSWNLGWDSIHTFAQIAGFDRQREDEVLESIDWPSDGYRLFELGSPTWSSSDGWFQRLMESNALFMSRGMWAAIGGADERFDEPGGGFLNLDMLRKALELPGATQVVLLGEATFHQVHGDTQRRIDRDDALARGDRWRAQYQQIHGRPWELATPEARMFVGTLPMVPLLHLVRAALEAQPGRSGVFGEEFDQELWSLHPSSPTGDNLIDGAITLAQREFRERRYEAAAAVCREARRDLGDVPELMRLLSLASTWTRLKGTKRVQMEVHTAIGAYHQHAGRHDLAEKEFRQALAVDGNAKQAAGRLAQVLMPGPGYAAVLTALHRHLRPGTYLEIGVAEGLTLALAEPPTVAIGIDPVPTLETKPKTTTHVFPTTSDAFFESGDLTALIGAKRIDLAFIDGLHHFEQSLRDFANVERWSTRETVVVFHDTVPLDARTQERERSTTFWTGDVWKVVACLREARPDLDIFTIATPPSGLAVVTALDPDSTILFDRHERLVAKYMDVHYEDVAGRLHDLLELTPSTDWPTITRRLDRRRSRALAGAALGASQDGR